jgi:Polyketide cyclase / dehydrase and lipid transport
MKWVLWILGGLVIVIGLAAMVGAMLPLRHHSTRKARFRASPNALYAVLAGPPDWRTGVKNYGVVSDGPGPRSWWEEDSHRQKIIFEQVEARPGERLQVRIAQPGLPFGGTWTFDISPAPGGSDLRITEDGEIYNVLFRFMARFVLGYHGSIEQYLRDLGAKFVQPVNIEA